MGKPRKFAVGQRVWVFDANHRVYRRHPESGCEFGSPIFSEYFHPYRVVGVEKKSYLIVYGDEPDARYNHHSVGFARAEATYYTDAEKDDRIWRESHRRRIVDALEKADVETLRRVAELIGYDAGEGAETSLAEHDGKHEGNREERP